MRGAEIRELFQSRIFNFPFFPGWSFCRLFLVVNKDFFCCMSSGLHPCCFMVVYFFLLSILPFCSSIFSGKLFFNFGLLKRSFPKASSARLLSTLDVHKWKEWEEERSELKYLFIERRKYQRKILYDEAMISRVSIFSLLLKCERSVNITSLPENNPHFTSNKVQRESK